jgi:predicted sugar kinase
MTETTIAEIVACSGRIYRNPLSEQLIGHLLGKGAVGAGQSSWGPAIYALVEGEKRALALMQESQELLALHDGGQTFCVHADNRGARIRKVNQQS